MKNLAKKTIIFGLACVIGLLLTGATLKLKPGTNRNRHQHLRGKIHLRHPERPFNYHRPRCPGGSLLKQD